MGTNYYYLDDEKELHIGKSSGGWVFAMKIHPKHNIKSYEDWKKIFNKGVIIDEYETPLTTIKMIDIIENRTKYLGHTNKVSDSYAETSPNGLHRTKIGPYCKEHFETWEIIEHEFC